MPNAAKLPDPLAQYRAGVVGGRRRQPIPLSATTINVAVTSAFATVRIRRTFRNVEDAPIEATMTFPVPVDAVAHGLRVELDGRALVGVAEAKVRARAAYEAAIDAGKTAILHEEALKGVHVLAIGHIPAGKEVAVEIAWSKPLTFAGAMPTLRLPTTVAEIYGRLPLLPADDLVVHDKLVFEADLSVNVSDGVARLRGDVLGSAAPVRVRLDRPIDLAFAGLSRRDVAGLAADGRAVTLAVEPDHAGDAALRLGILFDRSGSTGSAIDGTGDGPNVWTAARDGLHAALSMHLRAEDHLEVWQFDGVVEHVGTARGSAAPALLRRIGQPRGGTEAGEALRVATACDAIDDIVFLTDGRSAAIPVQAFAACGKRVSAVLCGANSLDALIGHLCALTGGQIIVAASDNVADAIATVVAGARRTSMPLPRAQAADLPAAVSTVRGGAAVTARWGSAAGEAGGPDAIGAYAAALALPGLTEEAATRVAIEHGLCTHLTSLVVIDEAGARQQGVPNQRKVSLSRPIEAGMTSARQSFIHGRAASAPAPVAAGASASFPARVSLGRSPRAPVLEERGGGYAPIPETPVDLSPVARVIDWDAQANALSRGDLSSLSDAHRALVERAAALESIGKHARTAGMTPLAIVIAVLAEAAKERSHTAQRIAEKLLAVFFDGHVAQIRSLLSL